MQVAREPYKEWADGQIAKVKDILEKSRSNHTQSVKDRISSVEQMKDVVSLTESLFTLSKVIIFLPCFDSTDVKRIGDRSTRIGSLCSTPKSRVGRRTQDGPRFLGPL